MEKIWLKHYEQGIPEEIELNQYQSVVHLFLDACKQFNNSPAFINLGTVISYAQVENLSRQIAIFLQKLGLKKGARVAIMLPNCLQYPVILLAILRAGYIVVNTNPLYSSDEVAYQVNDSEAEAIFVLANFAHTVEKALPHMPTLQHVIVTELGDLFPLFKRFLVNKVAKYIKRMVPTYHIPHQITFINALQQGKEGTLKKVNLTHQDIAFLQYTGGTTGISKGAMLTHQNMLANIMQASAWVKNTNIGKDDTIITALPLYHIFSLTANCLAFLNSGAKNILITNPRDLTHFIREIKDKKFTAITGVNTLFKSMLNHPEFSTIDFSNLKFSLSGGMALQQNVAIEWRKRTKAHILEAYGLTETSPAVSVNPMYVENYNGSIGLPLPSTDISVRDEEGNELSIGMVGELCVKGPQVMKGYWQRKEETEEVFWPDGFLRTGDIVKLDDKGFIYIVDRKKDMILVSGFNVYPNEVEKVINQMPSVLEVGVIGIKEKDGSEKVKACIVRRDENLTEDQILAHAREHLAAYKIPKIIEFYSELPKSNIGKILRKNLR